MKTETNELKIEVTRENQNFLDNFGEGFFKVVGGKTFWIVAKATRKQNKKSYK